MNIIKILISIKEMKEGWLLIDGAYLSLGIEDLKAKKILPKSFLLYTERNIGLLIEILSEKCKIDFKEKIYFTAEDKGKYHTKLYTNLRQQGVEVECRGFREKRSKCPKCGETHGMKIQAEVDVCIATKLCSAGEKDQEVVLIAGDRDFKTAIEFLDEEYEVRTWVAGFRASLSLYLISILNRGYSIYMDDILKELLRRRGLVSPRVPGVPTHPKMLPQGPEPIYGNYIYIYIYNL